MTNQEEYEILKDLDDRLGWLARDSDGDLVAYEKKPEKSTGFWFDNGSMVNLGVIFDVGRLFQFIQWEDEEPHNISDLIKEYERNQAYEIFNRQFESLYEKIKETEVEKDLKEAILSIEVTQFDGQKADLEELVNPKQLEKVISDWMPEVLSQEWIDEYAQGDYDEWVYTEDLQNLFVPKQKEVKRAQIPEWIIEWYQGANNEFSTLEDVFSNLSHDTNYNIVGSEEFRSHIMKYGGFSKMYEALSHIYFGVYEIEEEEQLFHVYLGDGHFLVSEDDLKEPHAKIRHQEDRGFLNYNMTFTEQEIKDYDERYLAFKEQVEEAQSD